MLLLQTYWAVYKLITNINEALCQHTSAIPKNLMQVVERFFTSIFTSNMYQNEYFGLWKSIFCKSELILWSKLWNFAICWTLNICHQNGQNRSKKTFLAKVSNTREHFIYVPCILIFGLPTFRKMIYPNSRLEILEKSENNNSENSNVFSYFLQWNFSVYYTSFLFLTKP